MKNKTQPLSELILHPNHEYIFHQDQLAMALNIPNAYSCGMCGKQFKDLHKTWKCVTNDVVKLSSFPIREVTSHEACYFQCLLCLKNYVNIEDMALCLSHDLEHKHLPPVLSKHLSNMLIGTLKGKQAPKRNPLFSTHPVEHKLNNSSKKFTENKNIETEQPIAAQAIAFQPTPKHKETFANETKKTKSVEKEVLVLEQEKYVNTASDIEKTPKID